MRRLKTVLALAASVALLGCRVPGSGHSAVEHRFTADFDRIELSDDVHVLIDVDRYAPTGDVRLTVTGDHNLLSHVDTYVIDRTLYVETDTDVWTDLELRVSGTVGDLDRAFTRDTGVLSVAGLYGDDFDVRAVDGSRTMLMGRTDRLAIDAFDAARVDAIDLRASFVTVDVQDAARVDLCATRVVSGLVGDWADVAVHCSPDAVDIASDVDVVR